MRAFLILTFAATFIFSFALFNTGNGAEGIWLGIGGAIFLTFVGWIVARSTAPRYGAAMVAAAAGLALLGHIR